ncbi:flagellin [Paracoccus sp. CPCC 101403]|uniref:Flagellin n=1 Tax=Paracoccus broussonetiae TaxID=3075834 RepID=A0ABU3EFT9_9RHOB|nr:flagellin [Paracoccus sp. CPCC 101403]MDT1063101.1 flagellin [Paracoccus sp. CPCC 101403]
MTNFNSISDLSRAFQMRLGQSSLKARVATLSEESATGVKADIPKALGGDLGRITQIESRLTLLDTHARNLAEAQSFLGAAQSGLENIQSRASATGTVLLSDALVSSEASLNVYLNKAPGDLRAVIDSLNSAVAGRYVFAGSRTEQAPVVGYDAMMAQISAAVGGATTAADILAGIDAYFDAPAGGGGFADTGYLGNDTGNAAIAISPETRIAPPITASSQDLRAALKGFAIMAYAAEAGGLDHSTRRELSRAAGGFLVQGEMDLTEARTLTGVGEEKVAQAITSNQAERSALQVARNGLIAADPYETATALQEAEAQIETLYAITARLSKLSLADYL